MNEIKSVVDMATTLKSGDRFYIIRKGFVHAYIFAGNHPIIKKVYLAISNSDYLEAIVITESLFVGNSTVLAGEFDSEQAGLIMISQHEREINSIKEAYMIKEGGEGL